MNQLACRLLCVCLAVTAKIAVAAPASLSDAYPAHPDFTVSANGHPLHVWRGAVATETSFHPRPYKNQTKEVGFVVVDLADPADFEVRVARPTLQEVAIKPHRAGVKASVEGDVIRFRLERPGNYIVELNRSPFDHLYVFANAPEKDAPKAGGANVLYFGPGLHRPGLIDVKKDGQTIYLAEGAVVRGRIRVRDRQNVTICGRGILDAVDEPDKSNPVLVEQSRNVRIRDIVILNARGWTVRLNDSRQLRIEGLREICHHQNSDGIDPLNCEDVVIRNTFQRVYDDGIVVKTQNGGASRRILAEGCIVICDHATPLKIGANEMMGREVRDVTFRDCDILYSCATGHLGVMDQGTAVVSNVRFESIRIESSRVNFMGVKSGLRKQGVHLFVLYVRDKNAYATKSGRIFVPGSISGVVFKDVSYRGNGTDGGVYVSQLAGLDAQHRITDVLFENVTVNGQPLTDGRAAGFTINEFTDQVRFVTR